MEPMNVTSRGWFEAFDYSILMREGRRWKRQRRWLLYGPGILTCGIASFLLVSGVLLAPAAGERVLLTILTAMLMGWGAAIGFFQSMQVLRRELSSQTLEGLFLTLQETRSVMLSVVLSGFAAGLVVPLVFFPVVLFASLALEVPAGDLAAVALSIGACGFLGAAAGAIWLFVGHQWTATKVTGTRVLLNLVGLSVCAAFVMPAMPAGSTPIERTFTSIGVYLLFGAAVWSYRALSQDAQVRREIAGYRLIRNARVLGATLLVCVAADFAIHLALGGPSGGPMMRSPLLLFSPMPLLDAISPAGPLPGSPATAPSSGLDSLLIPALFSILVGLGLTASSIHLYRRVRSTPELTSPQPASESDVVDVGRDDWRGLRNPILTRELRTRLRSGDARLFLVISTLLSAAACLVPLLDGGGIFGSQFSPSGLADVARTSFISVCIAQLGIVLLIGPGVGAETISSEREKKTYELLVATRLTGAEIYRGKVLGLIALLALLVSPSLPLIALAALLHGVTLGAAAAMIAVLALFVVGIALTSVAISALVTSSVNGKWVAYTQGLYSLALFAAIPSILAGGMTDQIIYIPLLMALGLLFSLLSIPAAIRLRGARKVCDWVPVSIGQPSGVPPLTVEPKNWRG